MEYNIVIVVIILIVYSIGVFINRFNSPKIKGAKGEYSVARLLRKLNRKEYKVLNDIYIKTNRGITQIDHLIISVYGIFVIETKNYHGWIHGSEKSEYWTQSFYKKKRKFRNPIKQNGAHIYLLKNALLNFKQVKYHSIIVFAGKAKLKNIYSNIPVVYKNKLLKTIKQNEIDNLSINQVENIINQLNEFFIINDKQQKREHKKYVKRNIYERKRNVKALICPNCKGDLVVRKGEYGKFYGCSNFPKCKFSKNI